MVSICLSKSFNHAKSHAFHFNKAPNNTFIKTKEKFPYLGPPISSSRSLPYHLNCTLVKMKLKACSTSNESTTTAPVAIGTRGTVGSLVRREIEYFSEFEIQPCSSYGKPQGQIVDIASCSGHSRISLWFMLTRWKRKRKRQRGSSSILPSICSAVEVADRNRLNGIPGFNYWILKNDVNNLRI